MSNEMNKISVVILNWNGADMMRRFLPSVIEHSPETDIVVADNGSTDESLQMLASEFPQIKVIAFDKNYGFAEGYNRALEQIDTPYTILLNNDVEVTPDWLQPLLTFMDSHPEAAACQPKLLNEQRRDHFEYAGACGGFIDWLGYPYCRGRVFSVVEQDNGQYDEPLPVFWATGAALLVRTALYKEVGGLDTRFFAHQEEIDLCWRLRSRGHQIWCIPQSKVYHVGGATLNQSNPRKTFLNFRNNLLMLYKNLPQGELQYVLMWRYVLDYLAALQMILGGRADEAKAVRQARREFTRTCNQFDADRQRNIHATTVETIPEIRSSSLLWAFYILRRRKYSQL
jgi:GT2 family glycosyltransferase